MNISYSEAIAFSPTVATSRGKDLRAQRITFFPMSTIRGVPNLTLRSISQILSPTGRKSILKKVQVLNVRKNIPFKVVQKVI